MTYVIDIGVGASPDPTLAEVGGKALNLIRLSRAGFTVPHGFVLTTDGYCRFVLENALDEQIRAELARVDLADPAVLDQISAGIRTRFRRGSLAPDLRDAITRGMSRLPGSEPVAVRSSATAEDLPGLSFAGQQDSYLNIIGPESVCAHVIECWASLWTARAIGYRHAHGVDHLDAALAVVVQTLVPADTSGVLFTANPVTGMRAETVVDATAGLGEALVAGQLEPDHFVMDPSGRVLQARAGSKATRTRLRADGGVQTTTEPASHELSLTTAQLGELAELARQIEAEYGSAQDVEWSFAGNTLWVLQSRPITTLFEVPVSLAEASGLAQPDDGFAVWLSFGAVQGVLVPITPLGRDLLAHLAAGATALFGPPRSARELGFLGVAHERLFIRIDGALRHPIGRKLVVAVVGIAEPGSADRIGDLLADPRLHSLPPESQSRRIPVGALRTVGALVWRVGPHVVRSMTRPERAHVVFDRRADDLVRAARLRQQAADYVADPHRRLHARITAARASAAAAMPTLLPAFGPLIAPCMIMLRRLDALASADTDAGAEQLALQLLRGLDGNVTTEMDLRLWRVATAIREAGEAESVAALSPADLATRYRSGDLPPRAQAELTAFLDDYGVRGVAEIDIGRPRWREEPGAVLATLASYLQLTDDELAPTAVYARGVASADQAAVRLRQLAPLSRKPFVRFAIRRIRALFGARETPKFTLIRILGIIRSSLLDSATELVADGVLDDPTDIAYLTLAELDDVRLRPRLAGLVAERREQGRREERRRAIPRLICSDGHAHYGGTTRRADGEAVISGSGVSPGVVEATVRVIRDPHRGGLKPGEILVCPGTDPAWTPLFLVAAGLVTEVGGMMTHGSVVAREYGIPAVVGVPEATTQLATGTRIRLDGGTGEITVLPGTPGQSD